VKASHETLTPLTLELGGKSANLIFGDADLDSAVPFAVNFSVVVATGQACALGTRLLVEGSVYDEVLERIQAYLGFLKVGDPFAPDTVIGPMITEAACTRVVGVIDQAISAGAGRLVSGGHRLGGELASGYYLEPTVFADVDARSDLAQHEIFGPVLCVTRFDTDDEAIHVANATDYGLAAFVQTKDLTRAHKLAGALDAGNVWINGFPMLSPTLPFGGYRQSGYGREGGRAGLAEYLQTKSVFVAQP
jgi:aldehyde dehydrogenase (NAD+)